MLHHVAIGLNRESLRVSARVVGHQSILPSSVEGDVAGVGSLRRDLVEERQFSALAVDGERAYRAGFGAFVSLDFVHRIQKRSVGSIARNDGFTVSARHTSEMSSQHAASKRYA